MMDRKHTHLLYVAILVIVCFGSIVELEAIEETEAKPVVGALEGNEFDLKKWGDSCFSLTEAGCIPCTTSSHFCHWCGKLNSCHAVGSPYGCLWGTSCYDTSVCMRKEPEFMGYAKPPWELVLSISVVVALMIMCSGFAILVTRGYARESKARKAELALLELEGYEVLRCAEDGSGSEVQPECLDDPSGGNTTMNVIEPPSSTQPNSGTLITPLINSDEKFTPYSDHSLVKEEGVEVDLNEATSTPRQQRNTWWLIWRKVPTESTKRNGKQELSHSRLPLLVYTGMKLFCGLFMVVAIVGGIFIAFYAPHRPIFNICSTQFDWGSIARSIAKLEVEADFEMLASVYNTNYFRIRIESGTAIFRQAHTEVGQVTMRDMVYNGGEVTDVLLTASFNAATWEELKLGYQYEMGQLSFLVDTYMYISVMIFRSYSWNFPITIKNYYVTATNISSYDRHLCNCYDAV